MRKITICQGWMAFLMLVMATGATVAKEADIVHLARTPLSRSKAKLAAGKPLTVVCFGDSITEIGTAARWNIDWAGGASKPEKNWGAVVVDGLRKAYPKSTITLISQGIGGESSAEGVKRLEALAAAKPDLVLVEFGSNDCGYHELPPEKSAAAMTTILQRIEGVLKADAVVVGIGGDNPLKASMKDAMKHRKETEAAIIAVAKRLNVPYADVRSAILAATENGAKWSAFHTSETDCHPNDAGHAVWAGAVKAALKPLFK